MGGSTSKEQYIGILNETLAETIVTQATTCNVNASIAQRIELNCQPPQIDGKNFAGNSSCLLCGEKLAQMQSDHSQYTIDAIGEGFGIPPSTSAADLDEIQDILEEACIVACKACVLDNNTQSTAFTVNSDCYGESSVTNSIKTAFEANVDQKLREQKDALANIAEALSIGGSSEDVQRQEIVQRATTRVTNDQLNSLNSIVAVDQSMRVGTQQDDANYSIWFVDNTQDNMIDLVTNASSKQQVFNDILSPTETTALQDLVDKNDTIGDITDEIDKTINSLADTASTWMYIVMSVIIVFVLIGAVAMFLAMRKRQKAVQDAEANPEAAADIALQALGR